MLFVKFKSLCRNSRTLRAVLWGTVSPVGTASKRLCIHVHTLNFSTMLKKLHMVLKAHPQSFKVHLQKGLVWLILGNNIQQPGVRRYHAVKYRLGSSLSHCLCHTSGYVKRPQKTVRLLKSDTVERSGQLREGWFYNEHNILSPWRTLSVLEYN